MLSPRRFYRRVEVLALFLLRASVVATLFVLVMPSRSFAISALAIGGDGNTSWAVATQKVSKGEATNEALQRCSVSGYRCAILYWFSNTCYAVATLKGKKGFSFHTDYPLEKAESGALHACGNACTISESGCDPYGGVNVSGGLLFSSEFVASDTPSGVAGSVASSATNAPNATNSNGSSWIANILVGLFGAAASIGLLKFLGQFSASRARDGNGPGKSK